MWKKDKIKKIKRRAKTKKIGEICNNQRINKLYHMMAWKIQINLNKRLIQAFQVWV